MDKKGLSTIEVEKRFKIYGLNDISEKKVGIFRKFILPLLSPISLMLLGAAILSKLNGKNFDFYFILGLYFANYLAQKFQEFKADKAIEKLRQQLSFDVWTFRDDKWVFVNAKHLVPGDYIRLGLGSIIPADADIYLAQNLTVNESTLTGESIPKEKKIKDQVFSGSFISSGDLEVEITATGNDTYFGKTIFSVEKSTDKSVLEKDVMLITKFLMIISLSSVAILTIVFLIKGSSISDILSLDLSLIIAGVPIALPAVMAIILSIGAGRLAKKKVIVRRLSALQDLANVNMLLTDKTGTLTKNQIKVVDIFSYDKNFNSKKIIELASYTTSSVAPDSIDKAILEKSKEEGNKEFETNNVLNFIPYDSLRKRSTVFIQKDDKKMLISFGASQTIRTLLKVTNEKLINKLEEDINKSAQDGYRTLVVAIKEDNDTEKNMQIIGLIILADPLYENSLSTIKFMNRHGIRVKILTGDNRLITDRITAELGLKGQVLSGKESEEFAQSDFSSEDFDKISAFSEILPKDKYSIVKKAKNYYVVASTGDGINDLPALKIANVGIAVENAVSALKSMADIILLGKGLDVIKDAIIESRKIFVRLYNYSIYRISESFRLVITILIIGLWYGFYPLLPIQIILLAFLNDIPIISLAFDKVKISIKPSEIKAKKRFILSSLFGLIGILNSLTLFFIMTKFLNLPLAEIQTIFFLKLTVSGHMLIFVAHTKERWYKYLPSKEIIWATLATQVLATTLAVTGFLMPSKISIGVAVLVWLWAFFWMQMSELVKKIQK